MIYTVVPFSSRLNCCLHCGGPKNPYAAETTVFYGGVFRELCLLCLWLCVDKEPSPSSVLNEVFWCLLPTPPQTQQKWLQCPETSKLATDVWWCSLIYFLFLPRSSPYVLGKCSLIKTYGVDGFEKPWILNVTIRASKGGNLICFWLCF